MVIFLTISLHFTFKLTILMFKKSTKINKSEEVQENSKKFKPYVVALFQQLDF